MVLDETEESLHAAHSSLQTSLNVRHKCERPASSWTRTQMAKTGSKNFIFLLVRYIIYKIKKIKTGFWSSFEECSIPFAHSCSFFLLYLFYCIAHVIQSIKYFLKKCSPFIIQIFFMSSSTSLSCILCSFGRGVWNSTSFTLYFF